MVDSLVGMNRKSRITLLLSCFFISGILMLLLSDFWFVFFPLMLIFLGILIYTNGEYDRKRGKELFSSIDNKLNQIGFNADDSQISDDFLSGIAINQKDQQIVILNRPTQNSEFEHEILNFNDIVEVSISEDGRTITKTNKGLAVGGALIAGTGGAIVGGLLSNKHSSEQILKATLTIVVDDVMNPVHELNFLNSKMFLNKNSELYQMIHDDMNKWYKRISVIIKRNEQLNSKLS